MNPIVKQAKAQKITLSSFDEFVDSVDDFEEKTTKPTIELPEKELAQENKEEIQEVFPQKRESIIDKKVFNIEDIYKKRVKIAYEQGLQAGREIQLDALEKKQQEKLAEIRVHNQEKIVEMDKKARHLIDNLYTLFNQQINVLKTSFVNLTERYHREMTQLCLAITEKIVGELGASDRGVIEFNIRQSLQKIDRNTPIILRINSHDYDYLTEHSDRLKTLQQDAGKEDTEFTLRSDDSILPGGCILELDSATVDARLDEQFKELYAALKDYCFLEINEEQQS